MNGKARRVVSTIFIAQETLLGVPLSFKSRISTRRCGGKYQGEV